MTLHLPDVTLCAVTSINHALTVRAMRECLKHCSFADVVLVSGGALDPSLDAPFRVEVIPAFEGVDYAPIVCRDLTKYTSSAFNLLVQFDSYILDAGAWTDRFLDYDYIGAKWPWQPAERRVGNSGFCLRSKKLLDIMAHYPLPPTGQYVDDTFICHTIRTELEQKHDIKIAPDAIADQFSYEREKVPHPTFGFHGLFNFPHHVSDGEMQTIIPLLDTYYIVTRAFAEVLFHYYTACNWRMFEFCYQHLHKHVPHAAMRAHLLKFIQNPAFVDDVMMAGE